MRRFHPYVQQQQLLPLIKLQQEHGIRTMSYGGLSPIPRRASGSLLPVLKEVAQRLGATEAQVLMKWLEQKEVVAVTCKSTNDTVVAPSDSIRSLYAVFSLSHTHAHAHAPVCCATHARAPPPAARPPRPRTRVCHRQ